MEHEITWDGDPEDALITTSGMATIEGLDAWVQEGLSDPRYRPGMCLLIDNRRLDWSGLTVSDLHKRIELFAKDAPRLGHASAAIVMRAPVDFGIARMEQTYIELHPELKIEMGVFFSIDDAHAWIRKRKAADESPAGSRSLHASKPGSR